MSSSSGTIIALSILALFLAGYLGQKFLPPPKPTAIGIDLGTTYSCATAFQPGTGAILVFKDVFSNKTCIPSIVTFKKNGEALVGYQAEPYRSSNYQSVLYDAKRFIGRTFASADALPYNRYPFQLKVDDEGKPFFSIPAIDDANTMLNIYPEQVSSAIIDYLVKNAVKELNRPVNAVVLAVPAEFDDDQRAATTKAAEKTGVKVLRLLNEPTSAAIAYGIHEQQTHKAESTMGAPITSLAVVLDVGGGTTDVAVLAVRHGTAKGGTSFSTLAIAGSNKLGGQDFTNRLQALIADKLSAMGRAFAYPREQLRAAAETAKILLTDDENIEIKVGEDLVKISRTEFDAANFDMFHRIPRIIQVAIEQSSSSWLMASDEDDADVPKLTPADVADVVLVGGSTRIPRIRRMVADLFGGRWPHVTVDPELAVATGAAVQAGTIVGAWPLTVAAVDITPSSANRPTKVDVEF